MLTISWRHTRLPPLLPSKSQLNLCSGCGYNNHLIAACEKKRECSIDSCKMYHRRDLHASKAAASNAGAASEGQSQ